MADTTNGTIKAVQESLKDAPETKVVICFQTDGQENSSTEHRWDELNALIKEKAGLGWQFNFMGVGIDAYDQGERMGVPQAATMAYDHLDKQATRAAFSASAENARKFAVGAAPSTAYSPAQKERSGDRFFAGLFSRKTAPGAPKSKKKPIVDDIKL